MTRRTKLPSTGMRRAEVEKIWVEDEEFSLGHAELQNVYLILGRDVN